MILSRLVRKAATRRFIRHYLAPGIPMTKREKDVFIRKYRGWKKNIDWGLVAGAIRRMPYSEFMRTPYWKAVAYRIRRNANDTCQFCGHQGYTEIHHITYKHHGLELQHPDDLICLCRNCHHKIHGK